MTPAWDGSQRRAELPDDWEKRRMAVMRRDGWRCRKCGAPATEVDHFGARDDHRLEVLQALCKKCHGKKSSAEGHAARRARPSRRRPPEAHPGYAGGA